MKNSSINRTEKTDWDLLFLGGIFPKEYRDEIFANSIGSIQNAANALQWKMIEGFDDNLLKPIDIANLIFVGEFPKSYKQIRIPEFAFEHTFGARDINLSFCNLIGIKHFSRAKAASRFIKLWASNKDPRKKVLVSYALTYPFINAAKEAKLIDPDIKTVMIVPDLPQYMNTSNKNPVLYRIAKSFDIWRIRRRQKFIDGFIVITKYIAQNLHASNHIVIEGIASDDFSENIYGRDDNLKRILYTGSLNERYGILNLVEAFRSIPKKDYRLILCGDGDGKEEILKAQKQDYRIEYLGLLPRNEIMKLQQQATVLVNPRMNNEEFTKYSFPSKNLEYMSSGTPTIAYQLDGIPEEYDPYLIYIEGDNIENLSDTIIRTCELPVDVRQQIGQAARTFVLTEKNKRKQMSRVVRWIETSLNN